MAKKTKSLRDFSKGLNTESALTDVDDKNLTRSVGVSIERPGVLRLLGKANSNVQINSEYPYRLKDDNDTEVSLYSTGAAVKHFDPGHGLFAFSHPYNYGERSAITDVASNQTGQAILANTTYVTITDAIGSENNLQPGEVDFQADDIVRIYNKNYSKELNNRYFQISSTNANSNRIYLKTIQDGEAKNFCLVDEANNRVAAAIIDTKCTINEDLTTTELPIDITSSYFTARNLFAAGDYIKIDSEVIKVTTVNQASNTVGIVCTRGQLGTTAATHSSGAKIYKYTYGPDHSLTWSGGGLTGTEDGYIEKVPQRNFTKYIACQNSELINLFVNDTSNHRTSTTFLREEVMDLKNDHNGSNAAIGIGLTNFGPTTQSWPKNAMLPDISFSSALRVSPSNKIGTDDTNYTPRWLGHINRNTMFGVDDSNTYINEWYYDTASIKKPSNAIESNVRSSLGYQSDYAKNNEIGTPWGHNWFSANYLNGYHNNNEISALSKFQECEFWEREGYENSLGAVVEKEINNDNDLYNISSGNSMVTESYYESGTGSQFRAKTFDMQKDAPFSASGTDTDTGIAYPNEVGNNARYIRLAESNYKRSYNRVATLTTNNFDITGNNEHYIYTTVTTGIWIGQFIMLLRKEDNKKLFCRVRDIHTGEGYLKVYVLFSNIDGTFADTDGNFAITSFDQGDEVYDASRMQYTKPSASSELLRNNSGKGYLGAYNYANARSFTPTSQGAFGGMAWFGYDAASSLSKQRSTVSLAFESDSEEEAGAYGRAITSITRDSNTITVTTNAAHGLSSGDAVNIYGSTNYNNDGKGLTINKVNNTSFTAFRSDFSSGSPGNETYSSSDYAIYQRTLRGLPSTVITKDESLDGENFIYHNSVPSNDATDYDLAGMSHIKNILKPDTDYYVTYTCRNFYATGSAKFRRV